MKLISCATCFAAAMIASTVNADTALPVFGSWECGALDFTLDETSYVFSGYQADVKSVVKSGGSSYVAELTDGYQFMMSKVTNDTLTWYSLASDDVYDCKRVKS